MTDQPHDPTAYATPRPVNFDELLKLAALIGAPVARTRHGVTVVHQPPAGRRREEDPLLAQGACAGDEQALGSLSPIAPDVEGREAPEDAGVAQETPERSGSEPKSMEGRLALALRRGKTRTRVRRR